MGGIKITRTRNSVTLYVHCLRSLFITGFCVYCRIIRTQSWEKKYEVVLAHTMKTCVGVELQVLNLGTIGSVTLWPLCAQSKDHWCSCIEDCVGSRDSLGVKFVRNYTKAWQLLLVRLEINLLAPELFFLILAHPVYKMWIIQKPTTLELWNKLDFEEKITESIYHV